MTFEIRVFKWFIGFSFWVIEEAEPQEIESEVFYNITTNEKGEIIKVPYYKPLV